MNINAIKERSSQTISFKDIRGKEVYPGDIIVFPISSHAMVQAMILNFNPKSIKCISLNKCAYNTFADFLKVTSFYDAEELKQWEDLKNKYLNNKKIQEETRIKNGYISIFFKNKDNCGFAYSKVFSNPGKSINISNIKDALSWINDYKEYEFYFFTKNMTFEKNIKYSNIYIGTDNSWFNIYMSYKNTEFVPNKLYFAHNRYTPTSLHKFNEDTPNFEEKNGSLRSFFYDKLENFKFSFTENKSYSKDDIQFFPLYRFNLNVNKLQHLKSALEYQLNEFFKHN